MKFVLRGYRSPSPIPSLGGGTIRYKPVIPMTIIGPRSQETQFVLVDSGSDDLVFPMALAQRIGVDLSQAPQRQSQGVGTSQPVPVLYAPVLLLLSDSVQTVRWRATVGFVSVVLRFSLFGIAGGLQFFRMTLDGVRELEIIPDATLPVTQKFKGDGPRFLFRFLFVILVTANTKEFSRVPGLTQENWQA